MRPDREFWPKPEPDCYNLADTGTEPDQHPTTKLAGFDISSSVVLVYSTRSNLCTSFFEFNFC